MNYIKSRVNQAVTIGENLQETLNPFSLKILTSIKKDLNVSAKNYMI